MLGKCKYGDSCRFSHDIVPLPYCRVYNDTGDCQDIKCKLLHRLYKYNPPAARAPYRVYQPQQPVPMQHQPEQPVPMQNQQQGMAYQYERATSAYSTTTCLRTYAQCDVVYGNNSGAASSSGGPASFAVDARLTGYCSASQSYPPPLATPRSSPMRDPRLLRRNVPGLRKLHHYAM